MSGSSTTRDSESVTKKLDLVLVRRIFSFVTPYRRLFVFAVITLALTSVGEMLLPVVLKRAIDDDILPYHLRLDPRRIDPTVLGRLSASQTSLGQFIFVPPDGLSDFSAEEKRSSSFSILRKNSSRSRRTSGSAFSWMHSEHDVCCTNSVSTPVSTPLPRTKRTTSSVNS